MKLGLARHLRALRWLALPLSLGITHVAFEPSARAATPTKKSKKKSKKKAGPSMDDNAGRDVDEGGTAPGTTDSKSTEQETEQVPATKPKPETQPEQVKLEEEDDAPPEAEGPPEPPSPFSRNWVGVTIQQSFLVYGDQKGVCPSIDDNGKEFPGAAGYSCRDASGYHRGDVYAGGGNEVHGGFGLGDIRILVGYDRVLGTNLALGARFGFALLQSPAVTGTTAPMPIHGEGHLYYYFGESPFMNQGFRPYVGLAGGVAEVDGKVSVIYYKDHVGYQNNLQGRLDVWRKLGPGFAAARVGFGYPFGNFMLSVEANLPFYFAYTGFAPSLGAGLALGF